MSDFLLEMMQANKWKYRFKVLKIEKKPLLT